MTRREAVVFVSLVLIFVIALGGAAYLFLRIPSLGIVRSEGSVRPGTPAPSPFVPPVTSAFPDPTSSTPVASSTPSAQLTVQTPVLAISTATLATYHDTTYGFEFSYPSDWKMAPPASGTIVLTPPIENEPPIDIYISSGPLKSGPLGCPFLTQEAQCAVLKNKTSDQYVRSVQAATEHQEHLTEAIESEAFSVQFETTFIASAAPDPLSLRSAWLLDQLVAGSSLPH